MEYYTPSTAHVNYNQLFQNLPAIPIRITKEHKTFRCLQPPGDLPFKTQTQLRIKCFESFFSCLFHIYLPFPSVYDMHGDATIAVFSFASKGEFLLCGRGKDFGDQLGDKINQNPSMNNNDILIIHVEHENLLNHSIIYHVRGCRFSWLQLNKREGLRSIPQISYTVRNVSFLVWSLIWTCIKHPFLSVPSIHYARTLNDWAWNTELIVVVFTNRVPSIIETHHRAYFCKESGTSGWTVAQRTPGLHLKQILARNLTTLKDRTITLSRCMQNDNHPSPRKPQAIFVRNILSRCCCRR